jgi:hypothetical protein
VLAVPDKVNTALTIQAKQTILYINQLSNAGLVLASYNIFRKILFTCTYVANRQTRGFFRATNHFSSPISFNFIY